MPILTFQHTVKPDIIIFAEPMFMLQPSHCHLLIAYSNFFNMIVSFSIAFNGLTKSIYCLFNNDEFHVLLYFILGLVINFGEGGKLISLSATTCTFVSIGDVKTSKNLPLIAPNQMDECEMDHVVFISHISLSLATHTAATGLSSRLAAN